MVDVERTAALAEHSIVLQAEGGAKVELVLEDDVTTSESEGLTEALGNQIREMRVAPAEGEGSSDGGGRVKCLVCDEILEVPEEKTWRATGLQHYRREHFEDPDFERESARLLKKVD